MATLSPAQLINLAQQALTKRIVSREYAAGTMVLAGHDDASKRTTITFDEYDRRAIRAASIMMAESGGNTAARCYNYDRDGKSACSPTPLPAGTPGTQRGIDRGVWQWNSVAWPDISDMAADEPETATDIAYRVSDAFTSWGPWRGSRGLDPNSEPSKIIAAQYRNMMGVVVDDTPILSQLDPNADGIPEGLAPVIGWAEGLGRLLGRLLDPAWWRRIGVGALGLLLVIIALVLTIARTS